MSRHPQNLSALALTALLATGPAWAATDPEIQALREELMALSQRLDALERSNQELRDENARLQSGRAGDSAATADLAETTHAVVEQVEHSSGAASWADSVRIKGDFRFRHETIEEQMQDDRRRNRIRARAAIIADVNDEVEVGLGLASGGDDPVSTNQTLGGGGSTKDINLDLAYFAWSGLANTRIVGGKFKNVLYRPGKNGFLWDGDWNPEGLGLSWRQDDFFINAMGSWLESDSKNETEFSYGVQAGFSRQFDGFDLTAGVAYYQMDTAGKGSFFGEDDDFFGNSFDPVTNTYVYDYHELELFAELGFDLAGRPLGLFFDYVQNQDAPAFDTGYAAGVKYGSAKAPGTWALAYIYQDLEADAALGLLVDSDFGGGGTDSRGHILKGGYAIARGWTADFTYFKNDRYISSGDTRDFDRLQLDLNFKY